MISILTIWLNKYIRLIELAIAVLWSVTLIWTTHRIDGLLQTEKTVIVYQKQIKEVHDVKYVHDKINAMPATDVTRSLQKWERD